MARVKAIFDADILIHLISTESIDLVLDIMEYIYLSDYVYLNEIHHNTNEGKVIEKLKKKGKIKILKFENLTPNQQQIYKETYKLLKTQDVGNNHDDNLINEGERFTAAFAKANNIYYYMSDDNRAAP